MFYYKRNSAPIGKSCKFREIALTLSKGYYPPKDPSVSHEGNV